MKELQLTKEDKKAYDMVFETLKLFPESRDKDIQTILAVWKRQGVRFTPEQEQMLLRCISPVNIIRCKRFLQQKRLFMPKKPDQPELLAQA